MVNQQCQSSNVGAKATSENTHLPSQKRNIDGAEIIGQGGRVKKDLYDEHRASALPRVASEKELG